MKIRSIYKNWASLPSYFLSESKERENYQLHGDFDYNLHFGKEYVVYGITIRDDFIWYYLCDSPTSDYPTWKPSPFFEIVDSRLSRFWIYNYKKFDDYPVPSPIFAFPEWANEHPGFYDRLTDWEPEEMAIFKKYKDQMDLEFPDSSISESAQFGDEEWLICPTCFDAWQYSNDKDALVKCPNCLKVVNNPRYKNEYPHQ